MTINIINSPISPINQLSEHSAVKKIAALADFGEKLSGIPGIFFRVREFITKDEEGKYFADRRWQSKASTILLSGATATDALGALHFINVLQIGSAIPVVNIVGSAFMIGQQVFSIWDSALKIKAYSEKQFAIRSRQNQVKKNLSRLENDRPQALEFKSYLLKKCDAHLKCVDRLYQKSGRTVVETSKLIQAELNWKRLKEALEDPDQSQSSKSIIKDFCKRKIERLDVQNKNFEILKKRNMFSIAGNVAAIALFLLTIGLTFVLPPVGLLGVGVIISALTITAKTLNIGNVVLNYIYKPKKLPPLFEKTDFIDYPAKRIYPSEIIV